jgi:hypothetical protein
MLIKSTFKDYYDSAAGAGVDTSILYARETRQIQIENAFFADVPTYFPDDLGELREGDYSDESVALMNQKSHCQFSIIGFCGTLYVGLFNSKANATDLYEPHRLAYFGAEMAALNWSKTKRKNHPSDPIQIENVLKKWHGKQDDTLFKLFNVPIFSVDIRQDLLKFEQKNWNLYTPNFTINGPLSIFQFYKAVDPYSAFQSLQSYISGVLGTSENPTIEVSNNTKIVKAGFDLKTSFRKDKATKK